MDDLKAFRVNWNSIWPNPSRYFFIAGIKSSRSSCLTKQTGKCIKTVIENQIDQDCDEE